MIFGRRDFVRIGSLGALGVTLEGVLRAKPKRDISCILLWQTGGCGHLDTFDMKPEAPLEYRGEFHPVPTNVPGIHICEHLPHTARQMDKFTILRSMRSTENNHERATHYLLTGHPHVSTVEFPSLAAVISKELAPGNGLPPYVAAPDTLPPYEAGFDALDAFHQKAYDALRSPAARKAFDIQAESPSLRERYGRTPVGQGALLARRLVERGVRLVTVAKGGLNYDTHVNNFETMKQVLLPEFDKAFAALLEDLHERGLLDSTLVIAMGEFGRSPRINKDAGRDHHNRAWSICLAGAGIPGGRVLGATDKTGTEVTELPVEPEDLLATVYSVLGVDPAKAVSGGRVVKELFT